MPKQITGYMDRIKQTAEGMSLGQKVIIVMLAVVVAIAGVAVFNQSTKQTMAPLFTNLSSTDAAAIVTQLEASGVTYELTSGGGTILVPEEQLYDTRLAVASAGLTTTSAVGYALLDDMSMTSSEFQQQVTYQRALEGELASTIEAMNGVETASVKLALPEETVFSDEEAAPTASVFIETAAGASLGTQNVQAIANLVSASIEGMASEDVAVIDADGNVLSTVGAEDSTLLQASATADYEQRIASNVQQMLDQVLGEGNAVVSVTAELDYDERQTTSETFSSDPSAQPLSESGTIEQYSGSGSDSETGVLGPDNIAVPAASASAGDYTNETWVKNNAVNKVTEITETSPGTVSRQSVSVVTNADAAVAVDDATLQSMVAAAAGIDETRGDVLSVSSMAFDTTQAEEAAAAIEEATAASQAAATQSMIETIIKYSLIALGVLIFVIVVMVRSRKKKKDERVQLSLEAVEELESRAQAALDARSQALIDAASAEAANEGLAALEAAPVPDIDSVALAIREEITAFAQEQPAEVADVLRGWISSERR
ncbi:flagellar basal-body MS-ring/collar protein FliF [Demequina sp. NBRC 110054]|uniref:flagellar basal-body MS-ring/collar protein FliF n=1 Tax=Demequina sp. NBRC 110054 TaxID=1570343 RepID=UPI0009FBDBB7|nr:flagellar basal-body MS-ring/collar protein FliF [Demequina sp. NBRC 110054]